jgi:hypothetical protein
MTHDPLAGAIARRLQFVGDAHAYLRLLGLAVEETPDVRTALRLADEASGTVRAQARERQGQRP